MKKNINLQGAGALEQRLHSDGERLLASRTDDLAAHVMQAVRAEPARQLPAPKGRLRRWPLVASLAAAALALVIFVPREDPAHPSLPLASAGPAIKGQLASNSLTDPLRGLVNLGETLAFNVAAAPANDLLEREARLFYADVASLASGVIAELPLAALPSSWQEKLETL